MTRKRCHRRPVAAVPPRGLRPKLAGHQLRDLAMCHLVNLDAIARGDADEATLRQWSGAVLTWSRVAELLGRGMAEMRMQLQLAELVMLRYVGCGRVLFDGPEYGLARQGVQVMDALAELVDRPTAIAAAEWSEQQLRAPKPRKRTAAPAPRAEAPAEPDPDAEADAGHVAPLPARWPFGTAPAAPLLLPDTAAEQDDTISCAIAADDEAQTAAAPPGADCAVHRAMAGQRQGAGGGMKSAAMPIDGDSTLVGNALARHLVMPVLEQVLAPREPAERLQVYAGMLATLSGALLADCGADGTEALLHMLLRNVAQLQDGAAPTQH